MKRLIFRIAIGGSFFAVALGVAACGSDSPQAPGNLPASLPSQAKRVFASRYGGAWIDRDVNPAVFRVAVKDPTTSDRQRLAKLSHDNPRVVLVSVAFSYRQLMAAKNMAWRTLQKTRSG